MELHPDRTTLQEVRERLQAVSGELRGFLQGSEDVFLETGARLAELEGRSRGLLAEARRAVALKSIEGDDDPVGSLDRELAHLDRYLRQARDASASDLEGVPRLVEHVESILRVRSEFERIPPTLRMLGMNTRIENARSGARNGGMEAVADEVRRLADVVEPKFREIFQHASALVELATGARATAEAFLGRQAGWSERMLEDTRGALEGLRALARAEAEQAARTVTASEHVSGDLAAVLVSLQGHDASRQMLEHAVQELSGFIEGLSDAGTGSPAESSSCPADLPERCRVLAAQIGGAREHLTSVLEGIAGSLRSAAQHVAALSERTGQLGTAGSGSPAERVAQGVGQATAVLRDHVSHQGATAAAMRSVTDTVQGMATYVRDIQGVGSAVKLIALNALVETARAGDDGRVLAVLATSMSELAGDVVRRTGELSGDLREVATLAGALAGATLPAEASDGATIAAALDAMAARLSDFQRRLLAGTEGVRAGSASLRDEVDRMVARLAEAAQGASRLRALEEALEELGAAARAGTAGHAGRRDAYARYTMEAERTIHDRVLARVKPPAPAQPANDPTGLGANVELF